jgi:hypothetical protein
VTRKIGPNGRQSATRTHMSSRVTSRKRSARKVRRRRLTTVPGERLTFVPGERLTFVPGERLTSVRFLRGRFDLGTTGSSAAP